MVADRNDDSGNYPKYWDWDQDGTLDGKFLRLEMGHTKKLGPKPVAIFVVADAERSVWLFHKVLLNELSKLKPDVGERVMISYAGLTEGLAGQQYHAYDVAMPDRPSEVSWDDLDDSKPAGGGDLGSTDDANPPF